MNLSYLIRRKPVTLADGTLLLALSGWMDGGLVSTGTVGRLMDGRDLDEVARIEADPFYIYNMPGSMEIAGLFRPPVNYDNGLVLELDLPTNVFHADEKSNLMFFLGKEPNLRWQSFADSVFAVAKESGVKRIVFMGSFGGAVPHTRDPRLFGSVSHESLKPLLTEQGIKLSDYQGPGSFSSLLLQQAPAHGLQMLSLVAEIPGYLEGMNPLSIEAVTRRLSRILNQPIKLDPMRRASDDWEQRVTKAVAKDAKLAATIRKLEEDYDNQLISQEESA